MGQGETANVGLGVRIEREHGFRETGLEWKRLDSTNGEVICHHRYTSNRPSDCER